MTVLAPDAKGIEAAAKALKAGELVVFPTETVYGLGANALDPAAIAKVYAAKGRPADNPLIVHCHDADAARKLARVWPPQAELLAQAFWPGPLTLVLPRRRPETDAVAGALDTIALRVPGHPVAQALLAAAGVPVAAPSANRSGRPSPTRVEDAIADLRDGPGAAAKVRWFLDGGATQVGVESTVVLVHGPQTPSSAEGGGRAGGSGGGTSPPGILPHADQARPVVLRLGGISLEAIERVVGPVQLATHAAGPDAPAVASPGMKYRHYAPRAPVEVLPADFPKGWDRGRHLGSAYIVSSESGFTGPHVHVMGSRADSAAWARGLYAALRDLDTPHCHRIYVEAIPETGLGAAVMDRVRRAAHANDERHWAPSAAAKASASAATSSSANASSSASASSPPTAPSSASTNVSTSAPASASPNAPASASANASASASPNAPASASANASARASPNPSTSPARGASRPAKTANPKP